MARQKKGKNDLDSILEQLKKSYGSDSSDTLEDELLESPADDDDAELSAILEQIFASSDKKNKKSSEPLLDKELYKEMLMETEADADADADVESDIPNNETIVTVESEKLVEPVAEADESVESAEIKKESTDNKIETDQFSAESVAESETVDANESNAENEKAVEDVLGIMFAYNNDRGAASNGVICEMSSVPEGRDDEEESIFENNIEEIVDDNYESNENQLLYDEEQSEPDCVLIESEEDIEEALDDDFDSFDDQDIDEEYDENEDEVFAVADEEYMSEAEDQIITEDTSGAEELVEEVAEEVTEEVAEEVAKEASEKEAVFVPRFVLESRDYIEDPLQNVLPEFGIRKAVKYQEDSASGNNEEERINAADKKIETFDENDISMLLNFGYESEIRTKVGEKKTQEVLLENNGDLTVDVFEKPFGFCGKELTSRDQLDEIKAKYRSNRKLIIVLLAVVASISLLILGLDMFFEFSAMPIEVYPSVMMIEFTAVLLITMIMYKKFLSGVLSIIKFEIKPSSVYSFVTLIYGIFSILSLAVYFLTFQSVDPNGLILFGFYVSLYAVFALVADLLTCIREYNAFKIIYYNESVCTAEKHSVFPSYKNKKKYMAKGSCVYKMRKTSLISGYFKKISTRKQSSIKPIYLLGVVPILSLVVGSICFIFGRSPLSAVTITMLTAMLCIPFGYVCTPAIIEFVTSRRLREKNIAFIGRDSVEEMAKAEVIIFEGADTVEVTSLTEIHPGMRSDVEKYLNIAHRLFNCLGGTLSKIDEVNGNTSQSIEHGVVINEISANGINIHYNASMNILMGDQRYMLAHGIKVKTDGNLSTAVRGVDRSVIYVAFDGSPKLGFIVNSKINPGFLSVADALSGDGIKVIVETYEPHINEIYYDQNKGDHRASIGVIKPESLDSGKDLYLCDGDVISGNGIIELAYAVNASKEICRERRFNAIINVLLSLGGFALSCALAMLVVLGGRGIGVLEFIGAHLTLLLGITMVAAMIPCIIEIIRFNKNQKTQHNK